MSENLQSLVSNLKALTIIKHVIISGTKKLKLDYVWHEFLGGFAQYNPLRFRVCAQVSTLKKVLQDLEHPI